MTPPRQILNLALVGFMGTGKSSVGRLVAEQLHFQFVDTDELIETRAGLRISEIFAQFGEARFREFERAVVQELSQRTQWVISAGGGLAANHDNLTSLMQHAFVICLWATPETIWHRVHHQAHRPLLHGPEPFARICQLLAAREPFYRQADVLLSTENRCLREVAQLVAHHFRIARTNQP